MTSSKTRALAFLAVLASASSSLAAPPSAQDLATARALYKEGKDLRAAGNMKGAFEKLKAAHALGRTPLTGIELARVEVQLGLLVEARETCLGIARLAVESDETQRSADARDEAAKLAEELKPRLATLRIKIAGPAATSAPIVTVDGENVPAISLDQPRMVDPGHHVVTAHVEGGATVSTSVDVGEAKGGEVELAPPLAPEGANMHVDHPGTEHSKRSALGGVTIAGIVITSAGLVVGAIGGIVAFSSSSDLSRSCPNNNCPQSQWNALDGARAAALASTVSFSVAGAGVVLLVVGLLTHTSPKESLRGVRVLPDLGLDHIGVTGAF